MGIIMIPTYEARCDGTKPDGEECYAAEGNSLDREDAIEEAVQGGWLRLGRRLYCPECRDSYQNGSPRPRRRK